LSMTKFWIGVDKKEVVSSKQRKGGNRLFNLKR